MTSRRVRPGAQCAHCGFEARGYATVTDLDGRIYRVCHHETRDCYYNITVWGETLGQPVRGGGLV